MESVFICKTCDHHFCKEMQWFGNYGKCKLSRQYDGTIQWQVAKWIEELGCTNHSSIKNIEVKK